MKILTTIWCPTAILLALNAHAAYSSFDINSYCRTVADAVGGSYQIEESCRNMEDDARRNLAQMSIPPRVEKYCYEVASAVGGSYQIMESCVNMELEAKGRMD